jgi:hypothetical protein
MSMCDVPERVRSIADAYSRSISHPTSTKLPCVLVYQSDQTNKRNIYLANGQVNNDVQTTQNNANTVQRIECITSPALELFMHGPPYPSLRTNGYAPLTKELFGDVLSQHFRSPDSIWGLSLNGESVRYYPWSGTKSLLSFFDVTQGYDRHLYDVVSEGYLDRDQYVPLSDVRISFQSALLTKQEAPSYVTAPIFWMTSNCYGFSNRSEYMKELMTHIPVDSWGNCGRNKGPELPAEIAKIHGVNHTALHYLGNWAASKNAMSKHYKFTVAIENSIEHDYVTEKLWQPLAAGSVPLYYGAPNIDDWLPCENCIIDLRKFATPKAAAEFISTVSKNATLYAEYHKWREQPILPKFQKIIDYFQRTRAYTLESMVCAMAHSNNPSLKRYEIINDIGPMF